MLLLTAAMWFAVGGLAGANTNASSHGSAKLTLKRAEIDLFLNELAAMQF